MFDALTWTQKYFGAIIFFIILFIILASVHNPLWAIGLLLPFAMIGLYAYTREKLDWRYEN